MQLIIGLGVTGLSVARYLAEQGQAFAVVDTRYNPPALAAFEVAFPEASIWLGPLDENLLCQAERLITSPGVSLAEPALQKAQQAGVEILGDVELFCRATTTPILAITGSNAKSTVTQLTGELAAFAGLDVGIGGNIGLPVLDLLREGPRDLYVVELSSFQLETTHSLAAQGAALLNISEDHLDRYADLQEYIFAKQRIFHHARHVIFNRQDEQTFPIHGQLAPRVSFGLDEPPGEQDFGLAIRDACIWLMRGSQALLPASAVPLLGNHGCLNVLAAFALLDTLGLSLPALVPAVASFKGLPHRCQLVAVRQGVSYINDSKATNTGAALAAINSLSQTHKRLWLIMGGEAKGQDFSVLSAALQASVAGVALIGRDARLLAEQLPEAVLSFACERLEKAVALLADRAASGDAVLLAPACASFDQFSGYAQRGEVFTRCVDSLPA